MEAAEQCGRAVNRVGRSVLEWAINYPSTFSQVPSLSGRQVDAYMDTWMERWVEDSCVDRWGVGVRCRICTNSLQTQGQLGTVSVDVQGGRESDGLWWRFIVLCFLPSISTNTRRHQWIHMPPDWSWVCCVGAKRVREFRGRMIRFRSEAEKAIQVSKWDTSDNCAIHVSRHLRGAFILALCVYSK